MILRNSLFLRLLTTYIFLVALLIIAGAMVHRRVSVIVAEDSHRLFASTTTIAVRTIDELLRQADSTAIRIGEDPRISLLYRLRMPLQDDEYYDLYRANNVVASNRMSDDFVLDRLVVVRENGIVISERFATTDFLTRHEHSLIFKEFSNLEIVNRIFADAGSQSFWPLQEVTVQGVPLYVISHVRRLPLNIYSGVDAAVITLLDGKQIEDLFRPILDVGGIVRIRDYSDNPITQFPIGNSSADTGESREPGEGEASYPAEERLTSVFLITPYSGWQVEAQLPDAVILERVREATASYRIITLIAVLLSLVFAMAFTTRNVAPVRTIIRILGIDRSRAALASGPYETIQASVTDIMQSNQDLRKRVDDQRILMRDSFIRRLIAGVQVSDEWLVATAATVGIPADNGPFIILAFRIGGYRHSSYDSMTHALQELDIARATVEHTVERLSSLAYFHHDTPELSIGLVFENSFDPASHRNAVDKLIAETRTLLGQGNIIFSVGVGRQVSDLSDAAVSYRDAIEAVELADDGAVVWFDQVQTAPRAPYYPIEVQTSLIQQALNGYREGVLATLKQIHDRNIKERDLKPDDIKQLIYEMRGTILKLLDRSKISMDMETESLNSSFRDFELKHDINAIFEALNFFYSHFCEIAGKQVVDKTALFRKTLVEFIDANTGDHNLCLKMVGVEFGLSEKYLSTVFKEQTSENFGTYIEKRRMDNAANLLSTTDMDMKDIAAEVGYSNNNTFYKAFKRWFGMSPGQYRTKTVRSHRH